MTRDQALAALVENERLRRTIEVLNTKLIEYTDQLIQAEPQPIIVNAVVCEPGNSSAGGDSIVRLPDRVKVAPNIFRRGRVYQVVWQQDRKQMRKNFETLEEANDCRRILVAAGRIKEAA